MSPILQTIIQVVTVVLGWAVVHRLSAVRDKKKMRIEVTLRTIDALNAALNALLDDARKYHTLDRDQALEMRIKVALQDFSATVRSLRQVVVSDTYQATCEACVTPLRRAITAVHFEDEHVEPLPASDPRIEAVAAEVSRVKGALARLRNDQLAT